MAAEAKAFEAGRRSAMPQFPIFNPRDYQSDRRDVQTLVASVEDQPGSPLDRTFVERLLCAQMASCLLAAPDALIIRRQTIAGVTSYQARLEVLRQRSPVV